MTSRQDWLAVTWPFVSAHLPLQPARVIEVGCGSAGGFVPYLRAAGHRAEGVDPQAPTEPGYHRTEFENYRPQHPADVIVACTSLHHVDDIGSVLDLIAGALVPGGTLIVVEWAWEQFDDASAQWCFARLPEADPEGEPAWLQAGRDGWLASGQSWSEYRDAWAAAEGLHPGHEILRALRTRFTTVTCAEAPYFFADLDHVSAATEQAAIEAGQLNATGIHFVGQRER